MLAQINLDLPAVGAADEICRLHGEIEESLRTSLDKAMRIGELLTEQKAALPHGRFLPWVAENLPFTDRTARNYMRIHRERARLKSESVSDLGAAYKLLAAPHPDQDGAPLIIVLKHDRATHVLDFDPLDELTWEKPFTWAVFVPLENPAYWRLAVMRRLEDGQAIFEFDTRGVIGTYQPKRLQRVFGGSTPTRCHHWKCPPLPLSASEQDLFDAAFGKNAHVELFDAQTKKTAGSEEPAASV